MRTRKAWSVDHPDYDEVWIFYAPNRNKARSELARQFSEFEYNEGYSNWTDAFRARILRSKRDDLYLPDRNPIADTLTKSQLQKVRHAYGNGHREHYNTDPGDPELCRLTFEHGLFHGPYVSRGFGDSAMFYLTKVGKQVAKSCLPLYGKYYG